MKWISKIMLSIIVIEYKFRNILAYKIFKLSSMFQYSKIYFESTKEYIKELMSKCTLSLIPIKLINN